LQQLLIKLSLQWLVSMELEREQHERPVCCCSGYRGGRIVEEDRWNFKTRLLADPKRKATRLKRLDTHQ
jgi:hypothetical protein